jgi:hypothetical protein
MLITSHKSSTLGALAPGTVLDSPLSPIPSLLHVLQTVARRSRSHTLQYAVYLEVSAFVQPGTSLWAVEPSHCRNELMAHVPRLGEG